MKLVKSDNIVFKNEDGEIFTTSLLVAEKFEKRHDAVLRKIERLSGRTLARLQIVASEYIDTSGKRSKIYLLNRDAFAFVAMSFTGAKAEEFKLDYIDAFNKMERHLKNIMTRGWLEGRTEAAIEYKAMCRTLDETRKLQGKETKTYHYANEAKLVNYALTGEFKKVDRDKLSKQDLKILFDLEVYNAALIGAGHDRESRKNLLKSKYAEASIKYLR